MPSLRALSVRAQLMALVAIFALSLTAIFAWVLFADHRRAEAAAFSGVQLAADTTSANIELLLSERQAALAKLATRPLVRALNPKTCDPYIAEFIEMQLDFATFTARDVDGNAICTLTGKPFTREQINELRWYQRARQSTEPLIGEAFQRSATSRWAIALTHPIFADSGALAGTAILPIDLLTLNQQVVRGLPKNVTLIVTDSAHRVILRSSDLESRIGRTISDGFLEKSSGLHQAMFKEAGLAKEPRLFSMVTVPTTGWRVYAGVPEAEVLASYRSTLARSIVLGSALIVALVWLAWRIGSSIIRPITALAYASRLIASGQTDARAPADGPAEIQAVAHEFNRMVEKRRQVESDLRDSEGRFRVLTELSSDWYWEQDVDFRFTRLEGSSLDSGVVMADKWLGRTRWEVPSLNVSEAEWAQHRQMLLAHQPFSDFLMQVDYGDGHVRWEAVSGAPIFDHAGNFAGYRGVGHDLTEQYLSQQQMKLLEACIARVNDMIIITEAEPINAPGPRIVFVNDAFVKITGFSRDEAIGQSPRILQGPKSDRVVLDRIRRALNRGEGAREELVNYSKSGKEYWIDLSIAPVVGLKGQPTHFVAVQRDITERKLAEFKRESLEAQLRESQKMEAVGTLAGGIAHDFNNILGAILGNAELARQDADASPAALESLAEIRKAGLRARDLIQQILSFSRRQPTVRRRMSLAEAAQESARLLRATVSSQVSMEFSLAADTPEILADPTQIQQVLINLVTNAAYAMHGRSGQISVRVDTADLSQVTQVGTASIAPGRYACLTVADTGVGMDEATLSRIFEPFFTTKPVGEGTGLGLAVAHGIVQSNDGQIAVTSTPGVGTTFKIYFREAIAAGATPAEPSNATDTLEVMGHGEHFLYLDDDASMVFLVERFLKRRGYRVSGFTEQSAALDELRRDPFGIALLVTDYNMPGMTGLEVAREALAVRADLAVALSSGYITDELRELAAAVGIHELIFKPNAVEEFCAVIQRLVTPD